MAPTKLVLRLTKESTKAKGEPVQLQKAIPLQWRNLFSPALIGLEVSEPQLDCLKCSSHLGLKCCVYQPFIPNFLIHSFLSTPSWLRVLNTADLLPLGLVPKVQFQKRQQSGEVSKDLLCPFFTPSGLCQIWSRRPGPCAAYVCKSSQGDEGQRFWTHLEELLSLLEQGLSAAWMLEAGFMWTEIEVCRNQLLAEPRKEKSDLQVWAHHLGQEQLYFKRAEEWFLNLDRARVVEWLGEELLQKEHQALEQHRLTSWVSSFRPAP